MLVTDKRVLQRDEDELLRAAYAAWFRSGGSDQPNASKSGVEEVDGRWYVVLRNVNGIMAVYRERTDGVLKHLKRWPKELDSW